MKKKCICCEFENDDKKYEFIVVTLCGNCFEEMEKKMLLQRDIHK